jgi:hypothetical protein
MPLSGYPAGQEQLRDDRAVGSSRDYLASRLSNMNTNPAVAVF